MEVYSTVDPVTFGFSKWPLAILLPFLLWTLSAFQRRRRPLFSSLKVLAKEEVVIHTQKAARSQYRFELLMDFFAVGIPVVGILFALGVVFQSQDIELNSRTSLLAILLVILCVFWDRYYGLLDDPEQRRRQMMEQMLTMRPSLRNRFHYFLKRLVA
jgi:hypothetical protein